MNAGAYGKEIKDVLVGGKVLDLKNLQVEEWGRDEFEFGYRASRLQR